MKNKNSRRDNKKKISDILVDRVLCILDDLITVPDKQN